MSLRKRKEIWRVLCPEESILTFLPPLHPPLSVVLRFRLRFTSTFVRLRRDESARQGRLRLRLRRDGRGGVSAERRILLSVFRWRLSAESRYDWLAWQLSNLKAPEDWRTQRRFAHFARRRQTLRVVECGPSSVAGYCGGWTALRRFSLLLTAFCQFSRIEFALIRAIRVKINLCPFG